MAKVTTSKKPTTAAEATTGPDLDAMAVKLAAEVVKSLDIDGMVNKAVEAALSPGVDPSARGGDEGYAPVMNAQREVKQERDEGNMRTPSKEEIESWSEEQIQAYNQRQADAMREKKRRMMQNREEFDRMPRGERLKLLNMDRDPSIIRESINPLGEKMVEVVTKVKIALDEGEMSDVDETIRLPLSTAKKMQSQGKVEVSLG